MLSMLSEASVSMGALSPFEFFAPCLQLQPALKPKARPTCPFTSAPSPRLL